jgi:hypothetical protein
MNNMYYQTGADMHGKDEAWRICAKLAITAQIHHTQTYTVYLR